VYRTGGIINAAQGRIVWSDRNGKLEDNINQTGDSRVVALAPDEKRIAVERRDATLGADLWIIDLIRGIDSKFTFGTTNESIPVWSPNGDRIAFRANPNGRYDLYQKLSTGIATEELLWESDQDKIPTDWSPDGRFILFDSADPRMASDIWFLPLS